MFKSKELNEFLERELDAGNEIAEESAWLPKCNKLIILKRHFIKINTSDILNYKRIADPNYWYE